MYRIVWEFDAREAQLERFEEVYRADGLWAQFFQKSADYQGTELFRSTGSARRFVTIDSWRSRAAYEAFRKNYSDDYAQLDAQCAPLLEHERTLGVNDDGKE